MTKRLFTEEEMELLKGSDYVLDVHPGTVFFSADFKELGKEIQTIEENGRE